MRKKWGMLLLEQVLAVGMLGLMLLVVAAMTIQTGRGGKQSRRAYEASCIAQNILELQMARAVDSLPLGPQPPQSGQFQDSMAYKSDVEAYSLNGVGPAAGLTDNDIRGVRVTISWTDKNGSHTARSEGYVVRIPR